MATFLFPRTSRINWQERCKGCGHTRQTHADAGYCCASKVKRDPHSKTGYEISSPCECVFFQGQTTFVCVDPLGQYESEEM